MLEQLNDPTITVLHEQILQPFYIAIPILIAIAAVVIGLLPPASPKKKA